MGRATVAAAPLVLIGRGDIVKTLANTSSGGDTDVDDKGTSSDLFLTQPHV